VIPAEWVRMCSTALGQKLCAVQQNVQQVVTCQMLTFQTKQMTPAAATPTPRSPLSQVRHGISHEASDALRVVVFGMPCQSRAVVVRGNTSMVRDCVYLKCQSWRGGFQNERTVDRVSIACTRYSLGNANVRVAEAMTS
jgi:hypothetical protein